MIVLPITNDGSARRVFTLPSVGVYSFRTYFDPHSNVWLCDIADGDGNGVATGVRLVAGTNNLIKGLGSTPFDGCGLFVVTPEYDDSERGPEVWSNPAYLVFGTAEEMPVLTIPDPMLVPLGGVFEDITDILRGIIRATDAVLAKKSWLDIALRRSLPDLPTIEWPDEPEPPGPLPPGFLRLEYMLFFRTPALFVTDVVADNQTGVAVDTQMDGTLTTGYVGAACGSGTSATSSLSYTRLLAVAAGSNYVYWGGLYRLMTVSGVDGLRHLETINWLNSRAITMDGVSVATALSATVTGFSPAPLSIGGTNNPDNNFTASQLFSGRIFGVKISQASEIVRDYVPCLDDAGVLVWYCLLTGHVARRKEFSGATWPNAGPIMPDGWWVE